MKPEYILDNDKSKSGKMIANVIVRRPTEVKNWKERLIVITLEQCNSIEEWLQAEGLKLNENYIRLNDIIYIGGGKV